MKTRVLLLAVILGISGWNAKAQYHYDPEPIESMYDYLYVFDTNYIVNCFLSDDPLYFSFEFGSMGHTFVGRPYSLPYSKFGWYNPLKVRFCDSTAPVPDGYIIGANVYEGTKYAEAFAQEYYLERMPSEYTICGVAIKLGDSPMYESNRICILNQNFDTLSSTVFHTNTVYIPSMDSIFTWEGGGWSTYYFPYEDYDTLTNINNFRIAFDVPVFGTGNTFRVIHTCNVYSPCIYDSVRAHGGEYNMGYNLDRILVGLIDHTSREYFEDIRDSLNNTWREGNLLVDAYLDTLKSIDSVITLCNFSDPKYLKHAGQWVLFEDDPVYDLYQNIYIAMVPIIMVPKSEGALSDVEMEKVCYLFPNPAKDYIKVLSHYTIKNVEIFDISGKLVAGKKVNTFEDTMDISNLPSGSYIVKIHTPKGTADKKLIIP